MWKDLSIRTKLFLTMLAVVVPSMVLVGGLGYLSGRAAAERLTLDHLTSVRTSKANQISRPRRASSAHSCRRQQ